MFDIGFLELLLIAIVGLFVIGPERLPDTIKTCVMWFSRIKRNLLETRQEIEKQLGADEIRRELHNEQVLRNLEKMKDTRAELEAKINNWQQGALIEGSQERSQSEEAPASGNAEEEQSPATDDDQDAGQTSAYPPKPQPLHGGEDEQQKN